MLNRKTDFVLLAEAFGAQGHRVTTAEEFEDVFRKCMNSDLPSVIDVVISSEEFVLPMLPPGGSIDDMIVKIDKEGENE